MVGELLFTHLSHGRGLLGVTSGCACGRHHVLRHLRLAAYAEGCDVIAGILSFGGIVGRRERHAVEHIVIFIGPLFGDDFTGFGTVDQLIGQSTRIAHTGGKRGCVSILYRLNHAHDLQIDGLVGVDQRINLVHIVAHVRPMAVIAFDILVAGRQQLQRAVDNVGIVNLLGIGFHIVAGIELVHHIVVFTGGFEA